MSNRSQDDECSFHVRNCRGALGACHARAHKNCKNTMCVDCCVDDKCRSRHRSKGTGDGGAAAPASESESSLAVSHRAFERAETALHDKDPVLGLSPSELVLPVIF